jgi:hypothetical protein
MEMTVCSQCWTSVVPSSTGVCPSCRRPIGGPSSHVPIRVRSGASLPARCVACDGEARRIKKWKASYRPAGQGLRPPPFVGGMLGWFALAYDTSRELGVRIDIPLCDECQLLREPRADFENATIEIIVDLRFAARCRLDGPARG